jgi:hypothetical protein
MCRDEVFPGCRLAPFRRRRNSLTPENVSDRFIANGVSEVRKSSDDPIVTPAWVLSRHAHDQVGYFSGNGRTADRIAILRSVELSGEEPGYQARMVSGLTITVTSDSAFRPSLLPISARGDRCGSVNGRRFGK